MPPNKSNFPIQLHRLLDIGLTALSFIAAYFIKRLVLPEGLRGLSTAPNYYIVLLLVIIIWYLVFDRFELYRSYRNQSLDEVYLAMLKGVATAFLVLLLSIYILKIQDVSRLMLGIFLLLDLILLTISKGIIYRVLRSFLKKGFNIRRILMVGSRERAKQTIAEMQHHEELGYRIIGCLEVDEKDIGKEVMFGIKVIGTLDQMADIIREQVVDEVIIAMRLYKLYGLENYISEAAAFGVTIRVVPDWQIDNILYRSELGRVQIEDFQGVFTMTLSSIPEQTTALHIKGIFDYVFALVVMVVFAPLFLAIAVAIKIKSPGPVFYTQERCGLNGRRFRVYKFRTMVPDAEEKWHELQERNEADGPAFKIADDPRIIPGVGTFLRKTSLDELPQFINILKGEMSLIGPRPPLPNEVEKYETWQRRRLSMKPGITCIWQTMPNRNEISFEEWMALDLQYIDNWSLLLDAGIFFKTIVTMLTGHGR